MSASTMGLLLDFIYGAFKPKVTLAEAVDLFIVSNKYAVLELHLQCTRILKNMINEETVCALMRLACDHYSSELEQVTACAHAFACQ